MAIKENPKIIFGSFVFKVLYVFNTFLFLYFFCETVYVIKVENIFGVGCTFVNPSYIHGIRIYLSFTYLWTNLLLDKMRLNLIATIVGSWHFHKDKIPSLFLTFWNTFKSLGTLSLAAVITSLAEKLNTSNDTRIGIIPWIIAFPVILAFKTLSYCYGAAFKRLVNMLTKYAVILHAITGNGFVESGQLSFGILSQHFQSGLVTELTSKSVLILGSYVLSISLALISWSWIDSYFGCDTFGNFLMVQDYVVLLVLLLSTYWGIMGVYLISGLNFILQHIAPDDNNLWIPPVAAA